MILQIKPLRGILKPKDYSFQLKRAEGYGRFKLQVIILIAVSILLYALSTFCGIGTESLSKELINVNNEAWMARSQLFMIGSLLAGVAIACFFLFLSSIYYWAFLQTGFQKIMVVQMSVFTLFLVEKALQVPLYLLLDIGDMSNILSLGIIAQYLSDSKIIIHLLSQVTILRIGMMIFSYYYMKKISDVNKGSLLIVIAFLYIFYWIGSGLLSYIKIEVFF